MLNNRPRLKWTVNLLSQLQSSLQVCRSQTIILQLLSQQNNWHKSISAAFKFAQQLFIHKCIIRPCLSHYRSSTSPNKRAPHALLMRRANQWNRPRSLSIFPEAAAFVRKQSCLIISSLYILDTNQFQPTGAENSFKYWISKYIQAAGDWLQQIQMKRAGNVLFIFLAPLQLRFLSSDSRHLINYYSFWYSSETSVSDWKDN